MAYVPVAGSDGVERVPEENLTEDELSRLGGHLNAIGAFLANEPESATKLARFEGETVAGIHLLTDLDKIEELASEGQLDIGEFYEQGPI